MSTNARWMVGLLLVLVIGLGVALLIVAGDNSDDDGETTVESAVTTELSVEVPPTTTEVPTVTETTTVPTTTDGSGGITAP
jgi:hypothetical protein